MPSPDRHPDGSSAGATAAFVAPGFRPLYPASRSASAVAHTGRAAHFVVELCTEAEARLAVRIALRHSKGHGLVAARDSVRSPATCAVRDFASAPTDHGPAAAFASPAVQSRASKSLETDPRGATLTTNRHLAGRASASWFLGLESSPDVRLDTRCLTLPAIPGTTASLPWLPGPRPLDLLKQRKTHGLHSLRGKSSSRRTRRFPCPSSLWFVVLRADHSLQFPSRPPSSRAFGWIPQSLLGALRGRLSL